MFPLGPFVRPPIRGAGTIPTPTIPTLTIPTRTIPTATISTSVIIVGLLSAFWRSPAPRSTCGTGRVRVRVSDTGACRNGECRVTVRVGMVSVGMVTCTPPIHPSDWVVMHRKFCLVHSDGCCTWSRTWPRRNKSWWRERGNGEKRQDERYELLQLLCYFCYNIVSNFYCILVHIMSLHTM